MEGLELLRKEVLEEAKKEALRVREQGEKEVQAFLADEKEKADNIYKNALEEGKSWQQKQRAQIRASSLMEERQAILAIKQDLIQETMKELYQRVLALAKPEKIKFYQKLLDEAYSGLKDAEREYIIALPENEQDLFLPLKDFFAQTYQKDLILSKNFYAFKCGFELSSKDIHINQGLDRIFEDKKAEWTTEIAKVFFL